MIDCVLFKPRCENVAHDSRSILGAVDRRVGAIVRECPCKEGRIGCWHTFGEALILEVLADRVPGAIVWNVVAEACSNWLIYIQNIDLVVPRPRIQTRRVRIIVDEAWTVLRKRADERGRSRPAIEPNRKWRILRILARFKEPEEDIAVGSLVYSVYCKYGR